VKRSAGILIPLFSTRTPDDLGRGEIAGLYPAAELALALGHRMIQLLPVDETAPGETSPYSAMSVLAIDPLYISSAALPGIGPAAIARARAAAGPGDPPGSSRLSAAKLELLRRSFAHFQKRAAAHDRSELDAFAFAEREWLPDYALFRALKERYRWSAWESWPRDLAAREPRALQAAARELEHEIAFYSYVQFIAYRQWREMRKALAAKGVALGGDLAFSPCRESAEVWANQSMFDLARTVGAPPDAFSATGQRWGLPMPAWGAMRAGGFALIRARTRRARQLFDLLRIDHVVGLYRTYGFGADPEALGAFDPADPADQLAQGEEIIGVIREEAGAMELIAEDLGVIPPFVRRSLAALGIPGYKVMRWEREWDKAGQPFIPPAQYPEISVATTGTHDTETLIEWWRAAPAAERDAFVAMLGAGAGVDPQAARLDDRATLAIIESLYGARSRLALAPAPDLFGWDARINVPGTVGDSNWKWRFPYPLADAAKNPALAARVAAIRAITQRTRRF
jgi:4-alpha-glucanotransferase